MMKNLPNIFCRVLNTEQFLAIEDYLIKQGYYCWRRQKTTLNPDEYITNLYVYNTVVAENGRIYYRKYPNQCIYKKEIFLINKRYNTKQIIIKK